ncbi:MAG: sensor histidine kinase [Actinomycetota bacterium]|nr:sensor histidine kinase [Actinomycetota bacterium]
MNHWPGLRAWMLRPGVADLLIALVVFVVTVQPLIQPQGCGCPPVSWWGYGLVAGQSLVLVWRRRFPFSTALLAGITTAASDVAALPEPVLPFAALVATYTVAAHGRRPLALLAAAITALSLLLILMFDPAANAQSYTVLYLIFATAWLLGDSARSRRERAAQLEDAAAQLKLTRDAEAQRVMVEERNRIAREMHDVVAHHVSLMVIQAEAGPVVVYRAPERAIEAFDSISVTGKQALTQMRQLLGVLRTDDTADLGPQPGVDGLAELAAGVREAGLPVELMVTGTERRLPAGVDLSAYRIVQEALTNALRHAGPSHASVTLDYTDDVFRLSVVDDGVGSSGHGRQTGNGIVGMGERARLVGGHLDAGPRRAGGWEVRAELPLQPTLQ